MSVEPIPPPPPETSTEPTETTTQEPQADCPAPRPGTLTLATEPWTVVSVDGVVVGTTPLFRHELSAGKHALRLTNEGRGVDVVEEVVVEEGHAHKLKLVLALSAGEAVLKDGKDGAEVDCVSDDDAAFVTVDTRPWAKVWVDGRLAGVTPVWKHRVSAGAHAVRLMTGAGVVRAARFSTSPGETVKLVMSLGDGSGAVADPVAAAPVSAAPVGAAPGDLDPVTAAPGDADPVSAAPVDVDPVTAAPGDDGDDLDLR